MIFHVWHGKTKHAEALLMGCFSIPSLVNFLSENPDTHDHVISLEADSLDDVFHATNTSVDVQKIIHDRLTEMFLERSNNRFEIAHTSSSPGDILYDSAENKAHVCGMCGWEQISDVDIASRFSKTRYPVSDVKL